MSASVEDNKIVIPIEVSLQGSSPTKGIDPTTRQLMNYLVSSGAVIPQGSTATSTTTSDTSTLSTLAQGFKKGMGGQSALLSEVISIAPQLGEILIAAGFIDMIWKSLQEPGGPLDMRFKRDIPREREQFLTRQEQADKRYGLKAVVITSVSGFGTRLGGAGVESTLREVKTFGVSKIGLQDKAQGWRP